MLSRSRLPLQWSARWNRKEVRTCWGDELCCHCSCCRLSGTFFNESDNIEAAISGSILLVDFAAALWFLSLCWVSTKWTTWRAYMRPQNLEVGRRLGVEEIKATLVFQRRTIPGWRMKEVSSHQALRCFYSGLGHPFEICIYRDIRCWLKRHQQQIEEEVPWEIWI